VRDETSAGKGRRQNAQHGKVDTMLLRGLAALLLLGGIVYAILSGDWGIGAIIFSLGVVVLGVNQVRVAQSRPDRAIGWVLVLCGVLTVLFIVIRMAIGVT
jgi:uncharacterized membrane protein